eukprot:gb/GEZN01006117.1/.p1 GENE.gb/GEZN01006117.1/~~gb/GEZN01006117.1/.p1  ORF type:complete len:449 (+),score=50.39 gb/GEZN01006117.1/:240-1586(+)
MSALTDKQKEELNKAILGYLKTAGYGAAFDALSQAPGFAGLDTQPKHDQMLEKKWRSIIRLQKKIMALEESNQQLLEDLKARGTGKKRDGSLTLPREPASITLKQHTSVVTCVRFHPVYAVIVTASEDATIKVWDSESGEYQRTLKGHQDTIQDLAFNPSGSLLASCSADLSIKLWDFEVESLDCVKTLQGHDHNVSSVVFTPNGSHLLSSSRDKRIKKWDVQTGFCVQTISGHDGWVRRVVVSPDGTQIASCSNDKTIRTWDLKTGRAIHELKEHDHVIETICYSTAQADVIILKHLVDDKTRREHIARAKSRISNGGTSTSELDDDEAGNGQTNGVLGGGGEFLLSGSRDRTIKIWDLDTGVCVKTILGHDNWVRAVIFHPSGQYVVSCADDKTVRVWDLANQGRLVKKLDHAHELFVTCLDWNHSFPQLATGGTDKLVKIWACAS